MTPREPQPPHATRAPGACDCHAHVFGPFDRFPVAHAMHYEPPMAPAALHRRMLERAGVTRGVLIQPGAYGVDPAAILDAIAHADGTLRGIAVATPNTSDAKLEAWHAGGIRGLRFVDMTVPGGTGRFAGSVASEALQDLAPRLRRLGWHAEIWARLDQHAARLADYREAGLPIVLDHMAGITPEHGIDDADVQRILVALREGWLWVKLMLCRCSQNFPDYPDLKHFHDAFIAANPDRVVWGSDWPHLRLADQTPDVGHLLDLVHAWVPDATLRRRILVENPQQLYDFEPIVTKDAHHG